MGFSCKFDNYSLYLLPIYIFEFKINYHVMSFYIIFSTSYRICQFHSRIKTVFMEFKIKFLIPFTHAVDTSFCIISVM